jgi:hypothetical protein
MFVRKFLLVACLLAPQLSFAAPVPADKASYVGEWQGDKMRLRLAQNGKIEYRRGNAGSKRDLNADLGGFDGNNFHAGFGFVKLTFLVSKPPYREGGKWKMVVDGVELTKVE